jgi:hypothetical protein
MLAMSCPRLSMEKHVPFGQYFYEYILQLHVKITIFKHIMHEYLIKRLPQKAIS